MSSCKTVISEEFLKLLLQKGFACLPSLDISEEEFIFLKKVEVFAAKRISKALLVCKYGWGETINLFRGEGNNAKNYTNFGTLQEL